MRVMFEESNINEKRKTKNQYEQSYRRLYAHVVIPKSLVLKRFEIDVVFLIKMFYNFSLDGSTGDVKRTAQIKTARRFRRSTIIMHHRVLLPCVHLLHLEEVYEIIV